MISRKNIRSFFILPGCLILLVFAGISRLYAQTTRYVPAQYSTISAAVTSAVNGDTIDITGTIYEPQIMVTKNLVFRGHGSSTTIIYCSVSSQNVFYLKSNAIVTICNITIRGGQIGVYILNASLNLTGCNVVYNKACGINNWSSFNPSYHVNITNSNISNNYEGIINNECEMIMNKCSVNNNTMNTGNIRYGGGFWNGGKLTINNSTVNYNAVIAISDAEGGGIYNNYNGYLEINNSDISNNSLTASSSITKGVGIYNKGYLNVYNSNISHNSSTTGANISYGGGIFNESNSSYKPNITINNCSISYNTLNGDENYGGGIYNNGGSVVNNSTIINNTLDAGYTGYGCAGGGLFNYGILILNNSTISNNNLFGHSENTGGGIHNQSQAFINNCTISYNKLGTTTGFSCGSGISNSSGPFNINNSTIVYNKSLNTDTRGKGIFTVNGDTIVMKNCILALNYLNSSANQDCNGPIKSQGYNLVGETSTQFFNKTGDMTGTNPLIDTLYNNGGPTYTQALQTGSPAINTGCITNINGDTVLFDQRGYYRGNTIDIGAFEHDGVNSSVFQDTDYICTQFMNQPIIKLQVSASVTDSISSFSFSTHGTTNLSEIQNIKLFYTGNNNIFSADTQIGTTINNPGKTFDINNTLHLKQGLNYFWLTYSISSSSLSAHKFDAACRQITFNSSTVIPYDTAPNGYRMKLNISPDFIVNDSSQCMTGNRFLFINRTNAQPVSINYTWLLGDDSLSNLIDSVNHSYNNPGTYQVTLNVNGCISSASKMIVVKPSPQALFTVNKPIQCFTDNQFILTNSSVIPSSADTSYFWNFGDNLNDTIRNASHHFSYPDSFNIMLIAGTSLGCTDTMIKPVVVYPSPKAAFSINDSSQCINGNLFSFTNQTTVNGPATIKYGWNLGDHFSDTTADQQHTYQTDDTFHVRLIAKTDMGCIDTFIKSVIVFPNPTAGFYVDDSIQCQSGNLFIFTNAIINQQPGIKYNWYYGDGFSDTLQNAQHSYLLADTFQIIMISSSAQGCTDTAQKFVIVNSSPSADFTVNDSVQCFSHNLFNFNNLSTTSKDTIFFQWDFGNKIKSSSFDSSISYSKEGNYLVSLMAASGHGCTDSSSLQLVVNPSPVANFNINDSTQCLNGNLFGFTNNSSITTGTFSIFWNFGDSVYSTNSSDKHRFLDTGIFTVKLVTKTHYGCNDSMSKKVQVYSDAIVKSVTDGEHCGPGQLTLAAEAINGHINWYSSDVGGIFLHQGDTFNTNAGTTYYVEAVNQFCTSIPRTPVKAFLKYIPSIVSTTPASRWFSGTVTLKATASAGTVNWYDTLTGGLLLANGNSFTTPVLTTSKTYYVDATYDGCTSNSRTSVTATVLPNSIDDHADKVEINIYPNPATDFLTVEVNSLKEKATLIIMDIQGKIVKSVILHPVTGKGKFVLDIHDLLPGIYLINLKNDVLNLNGSLIKY